MAPLQVPDRWLRVKTITADALERADTERPAFLAEACAGDALLLGEVRSLLGAHGQAGSFLDAPALADSAAAEAVAGATGVGGPPDAAGRRVGPYRILRELGRGGMGVVYLAARADSAYEKQVAIKVVRGSFLAGEALMERFRAERRILAALDHPNIARLLDGGTTDDGLPYLVMEHVDGVPIDDYARTRALSLRARLVLFRQVCSAVQYAHQRLVIHRDLKAGNILVTGDGTPKLLDFGIAKLVEPGDAGEEATVTGLRALSLEGASPEQVRGEPLTVTSDVYALGALLYRLLAGRGPYGAERRGQAEIVRAICEEAPAPPSEVAAEKDRRELRGELDWIALFALRKEPDRRYASVEQLSDDIQRHLDLRPVAAAPDSWGYRARRLVARRRGAVAASLLLAASLAAGVSATLWQARRADQQRARAERRFNEVRKLASSVMGELHDAIVAVPGATAARALLLKRALEHLDGLALEAPDDPALAEELATAYHRLGELQSSTSNPSLADPAAGRAAHRKGLALRRMIAARAPHDLDARSRLVSSLLATAYLEDQIEPSLALGTEAVTAAAALHAERPGDPKLTRLLASAYYMVGSHHREAGDSEAARSQFEAAAALYQVLHDADPGDETVSRNVALCHKRLGAILTERESPAALPHLRAAVALDEERLARHPKGPRERRDASVSLMELGAAVLRTGDADGAFAAYGRALALREGLMREDPGNVSAPRDVALALMRIGLAQITTGKCPAAITTLERAIPLAQPPKDDSDELRPQIACELANAYEGAGRTADALVLRRTALQEVGGMVERNPLMPAVRRIFISCAKESGGSFARLSRWDEAREAYAAGLAAAASWKGRPFPLGTQKMITAMEEGAARLPPTAGTPRLTSATRPD
jgi:tetratricopeptide (TPR) repeat protein/tRNA A-37 threonylcarbamoyl transferase component Bud32